VAELVSSEFFEQGDIERQELKITPIVSSVNMLVHIEIVAHVLIELRLLGMCHVKFCRFTSVLENIAVAIFR
jgi:hypothetical protein